MALTNISAGKSASSDTEKYLLGTLSRGKELKKAFQDEWDKKSSRSLEKLKRVRVQNFAPGNVKKKTKNST